VQLPACSTCPTAFTSNHRTDVGGQVVAGLRGGRTRACGRSSGAKPAPHRDDGCPARDAEKAGYAVLSRWRFQRVSPCGPKKSARPCCYQHREHPNPNGKSVPPLQSRLSPTNRSLIVFSMLGLHVKGSWWLDSLHPRPGHLSSRAVVRSDPALVLAGTDLPTHTLFARYHCTVRRRPGLKGIPPAASPALRARSSPQSSRTAGRGRGGP